MLAVGTAGLAACGSSAGSGGPSTPLPSATESRAITTSAAASAGSLLTEDLTFSGQVAGHALGGNALAPSLCGKQPTGSFAAGFTMPLNSTVYRLTISIGSGYTGPGTYPTASQKGKSDMPVGFVLQDTKGTTAFGEVKQPQLVVDAGETSGTIDGDYVVFESQVPVGHVAGRWRCG